VRRRRGLPTPSGARRASVQRPGETSESTAQAAAAHPCGDGWCMRQVIGHLVDDGNDCCDEPRPEAGAAAPHGAFVPWLLSMRMSNNGGSKCPSACRGEFCFCLDVKCARLIHLLELAICTPTALPPGPEVCRRAAALSKVHDVRCPPVNGLPPSGGYMLPLSVVDGHKRPRCACGHPSECNFRRVRPSLIS
jgi:hypothetical protein